MKNKNIFQWLCFCFLVMPLFVFAQTTRITYPINGMVFQQNANGKADVPVSALISGNDATNFTTFGYYLEKLDNQTGETIVYQNYKYGLTPSLQAGYFKLLSETINSLDRGWYRVTVGPQFIADIVICSQVVFGVGDVYMVAGQSNASGYGGLNLNENNPFDFSGDEKGTLQSFTNAGIVQHEAVRGMFSNTTSLFNTNIKGLPFGKINTSSNTTGFQRLGNGSAGSPQGIYPNGRDSWAWVPFANKVASTGTPTMLFNVAVPNTIMRNWAADDITNVPNENKDYFQKMRSILQTFGRATGVRAILWQQGENDTKFYAEKKAAGQAGTYLTDYGTGLDNLIKWSRKAIAGSETNTNLSWFVAKTSFNTAVSNVNWSGTPLDPLPIALLSSCIALRKDNGVNFTFTNKITSNDIRSKQQSTLGLGNVFQGFDSDAWEECYRSTHQRVHFSGNAKGDGVNDGLIKMANGWYDIIFNADGTYKNTNVQNNMVLGNGLLPLTITDNTPTNGSDGNYRLTAPSGYSKYFWVKDNQGIYDVSVSNLNIKDINAIVQSPEYWTCYVSDAPDNSPTNGWDLPDLRVTQTFISRNTDDAIARGLRFSANEITFPANPIDKQVTVISNSVVWDIISKPAWTTTNTNLGGFGETPLRITVQANTTGEDLQGTIVLRDRATIIADQTLGITQYKATSGGGNCTQVNLTTLSPTNISNDWQGYGTMQINKSIDGKAPLQVGGYQTNSGIGTHAYSRLVYNINNQYSTFSGKVGLDDEVDNSCGGTQKVRFVIKGNNNPTPLWEAINVGPTDGPISFTVPVTGITTLELIVEPLDNYYCDHADWLDPVLSCGISSCTIPANPTNTYASSPTITSGQSTSINTTCPAGSTANWNTGQTGSPVTVSPSSTTIYTVRCKNGTCESVGQGTVTVTVGSTPPPSGIVAGTCYVISPKVNLSNNMQVMGDGSIQRQGATAAANQIWRAEASGSLMKFASAATNQYITVGTPNNGDHTYLSSNSNNYQAWDIAASGGYYRLSIPSYNVTWDMEGAGSGTYLQNYGNTSEGFIDWRLWRFQATTCPNTTTSGLSNNSCYIIRSVQTNNPMQAMSDGKVQQQSANGQNNQIWKAEASGSQFMFKAVSNSQYIRVANSNNGTKMDLGAAMAFDLQASGNNFRISKNGTTWDMEGAGAGLHLQNWGNTSESIQNYRLWSFQNVGCPSNPSNNCTNRNVNIGEAAYASSPFGINTNLNQSGGTLRIGGNGVNSTPTDYVNGLGTHAFSEIIYDLGNHTFSKFKADVGRDYGSYACNCGGQTMVFKILNDNTGAIIGNPVTVTKSIWQSATAIEADIAGISRIKLVVEDGGDAFYGDWADWANARLECPSNNARQAVEQAVPEETIEGLAIFPNPTNDKLTTNFSLAEASKVSFEIIDMQGRNLENYHYKGEAGLHRFIIDVSKLNAGSYILRGLLGNKLEIRKFVVER